MKHFFLVLIAFFSILSCSKDDETNNEDIPEDAIFISINDDIRQLHASNRNNYEIDLSSFEFNQTSSEPQGVQFVMDIYDPNKEFIGNIAGINRCSEIEVFADVFQTRFPDENIETLFNANRLPIIDKFNKCELFIRLKDESDNVIMAGTSQNGQSISVDEINGFQYRVEFFDIIFETNSGETFTASGRINTL
ncbi:hypothetical protein [Aquimarina agarilytica]|uniref:hypothetical protein n=1 Tax=Aquimarina agarilytica TaxID=1087449 RepID=UPI0012F7C35D|nr:hypothetical protein [Aquimarina agarilytica]